VTIGAAEPAEKPLFRNCVFIGPSEERAAERLAAVTNELKNNDQLLVLYGDVIGSKVTETKLVLKDGRVIQAKGRDQDMRGMKHLDWRPDLIVVDDFEDKENVLTPDGRRKMLRRFLSEIRLACDPRSRVIVLCTIMDPDCVPLQLAKVGWPVSEYPIAYRDETGEQRSIWPSRFTDEWIRQTHAEYVRLGEGDIWDMEMMGERVDAGNRVFQPRMLKVEPIEHTFQAKWGMIDPAFTTNRKSATTGWAVWSWERNRLIVWEAGAAHLNPREIVDLAFRLCADHELVELGIEENGLKLWVSTPIVDAMVERGVIPYRPVSAPRDKIGFIRGLHWWADRGDMVFVREMPEMFDQLLGFPTGRIDAPNALAYATLLRPGRSIYDGWNALAHIAPARVLPGPCYLAANATRGMVSGVVVQLQDGRIVVLGDVVAEGDPGQAAEGVLRQASMFAGRGLTVIAGPQHFDQWNNVGLVQAIRNLGVEARPGGNVAGGRELLRSELAKLPGAGGGFAVSPGATWTLRAFAGGYSRPLVNGQVADEPANNRYRVLMEGLESLCGLFAWGEMAKEGNMAYDRAGRPYLSIIPQREPVNA
jgi:hypothetical protein